MMSTGRYNYYEILELKSNAPQHEVTTAYERAKATYTGDNPAIYTIFSQQEARELLGMIEEAYSVLGNKTLRGIYDQRLFGGQSVPQDLSYESILTASKTIFPESKAAEKKTAHKVDEAFEKQIAETTEWDGALLRKVRDYKGVTIAKMADITKVNTYYLQALEEMDPKGLPAPVFIRGYAVQVAKTLGLNEKLVADSYMKAYKAKNNV